MPPWYGSGSVFGFISLLSCFESSTLALLTSSLYLIYVLYFYSIPSNLLSFIFLGSFFIFLCHLCLPQYCESLKDQLKYTFWMSFSRSLPQLQIHIPNRNVPPFWPQREPFMINLTLEPSMYLFCSLLPLVLKNLESRGHHLFIHVACYHDVHNMCLVSMS